MAKIEFVSGSGFSNYLKFRRNAVDYLTSLRDQADLVQLYKSKKSPVFVVNSPEIIREILLTKDKWFSRGGSTDILKRTLGESILTTEGELHEEHRKLVMPAFQKQLLNGYAEKILDQADWMLAKWNANPDRMITEDMMHVTLRIIIRTMFGVDSTEEEEQRLSDAIEEAILYTANRLYSPVPIPLGLPTIGNLRFKRQLTQLDNVLFELIARAKQETKQKKEHHLLSILMEARFEETGEKLTDQELRNQVATILIAGHETTANALSWAWFLISQNKHVEQKFWDEIDAVQIHKDAPFDAYKDLVYTQHIILETLRLYPTVWTILREATVDVEIAGHTFPKSSGFIICPYSIHRNPEYFPEPDQFIPERFADDKDKSLPRFAYFPFGGGSHSCIGSHFAMMEATLLLASLGKKYALRMANKSRTQQVTTEPLVSLRIKDGLPMALEERS